MFRSFLISMKDNEREDIKAAVPSEPINKAYSVAAGSSSDNFPFVFIDLSEEILPVSKKEEFNNEIENNSIIKINILFTIALTPFFAIDHQKI